MKKLLILGGANQHIKLVQAAKRLGFYSIVTDYLNINDSPAKQFADEHWEIDINSIDELAKKCKAENIDGIIAGWLDPCQRPYAELCVKLNLPCYGTVQQFFEFTDKHVFKKLCKENNVDTIFEYTENEIDDKEFPLFVKPVDSRGSRGQTVCHTKEELKKAIEVAKKESSNGDIIIEKYMGDCDEMQVTFFVKNGEPYLIRTVDSYRGSRKNGLDKVVACSVSPSIHTKSFIENCQQKVSQMIKNAGIKNGPVFMQGFFNDDKFYCFDPGLRFPGVEYELVYKKVFGIDFMELMIQFALTGEFPKIDLQEDSSFLNGKSVAILFPVLKSGTIDKIYGEEEVCRKKSVVAFSSRYKNGDVVKQTGTCGQRYAEIDILTDSLEKLKNEITEIQNTIKVIDTTGNNLLFDRFDVHKIIDNSKLNQNLFVKCITQKDLIQSGCFNVPNAIDVCEKAFISYANNDVIFPDKVSVVFNQQTQDRINCLPAAIKSEKVYGMKWVSVFPENPHKRNKTNLTAVIVLSELESGFPIAFMEGSLCSNLRTAAVGAIAAKYLARKESEVIGFIGAGEQAKTHLMSMMCVLPKLKVCKVASRTHESECKFIEEMKKLYPDLQFISCNSDYEKSTSGSDIIVTAISGQEKILQADWIKNGAFYCHVAGLEDDFNVPKKATKIVCDNWNVVKHRTQTISQMYKQGLLKDNDIYADLHEIITGKKVGRESNEEFIYFNSVGMSFLDTALSNSMYKTVKDKNLGTDILLKEKSMFDVERSKICLNIHSGGGYNSIVKFMPQAYAFDLEVAA